MIHIGDTKYLTEKEVSAKYGLSRSWFRERRYSGDSPKYYKLNGKIFYTLENIDEWFKQNLKEI